MKRNTSGNSKTSIVPAAWREDEYAAMLSKSADTCDDRVSEDIFDVDDEHAEVDIIVQMLNHERN
jgi:hypothetical protein